MGSNDSLTKLTVIDFLLDQKTIQRHSLGLHTSVNTNFAFDLIKILDDDDEANSLFRGSLSVDFINEIDDKEAKTTLSLYVEMQFIAFITNIEQVDLKSPSKEHERMAKNELYPIARSMLVNELAFLKKDYSDIPYTIE